MKKEVRKINLSAQNMFCSINNRVLRNTYPDFGLHRDCGYWIAGGAIRDSVLGEKPSDIDIFGRSKEILDAFIDVFLSKDKKIHDSEFTKTFIKENLKIQVIYKTYSNIEECLDSFDFTICQFGFNGENVICNPESLIHLFEKKIIIHKLTPEFVVDSLRRLQKYIKKGYTICDGGLAEIVNSIRAATQEQVNNSITFYPGGGTRINRFD